MKSLLIVLLALLSLSFAKDACSANVVASKRSGGSWSVAGKNYQVYDISVTNTGSCPIDSLFAFFGYPQGGNITDTWNYDKTSGEISIYGTLQPSSSFDSAGFVISNAVPTLAFINPSCSKTCVSSATSAPSTSAPSTSAPSTSSPVDSCGGTCTSDEICVSAVSGPICAPRSCSALQCSSDHQVCINDGGYARCINVGGSCSASVTVQPRADGAYTDNGAPGQIFDLTLTNTGSLAITNVYIGITAATGAQVANTWNLNALPSGYYSVSTYESLSSANTAFHGAGFSLVGTQQTPLVGVVQVEC